MTIISAIDVGLSNLGFLVVSVQDNTIVKVLCMMRIDLTILQHNRVSQSECTLHHTNDVCDRVMHFVQEHKHTLDSTDILLIERQPLGGLVHVEQLLYHLYRDKAHLIHPRSMHTWLGIGHLDYETRKVYTIKQAYAVECVGDCLDGISGRKHDISDAVCMVLYWIRPRDTIGSRTPRVSASNWLQGRLILVD